ncbi:MAG: hypothetical protein D6731_16630 [Planctomycetota bacterium]|nr:MAG: hypothetical protein D6731_16630 [Planctomycetota bacterium]
MARADATSAGSGATRPAGDAPSDRRGLLEGTVSDDGGRLALALQRLAGSLVLERGGERRRLQRAAGEVALRPGDLLSSARGAFVSLDGGAFDLCLDRGTRLQVRAARSGPFLGLEQGRVLAEVATLPSGRRFGVVTREAEFHVLGTVFAVEAGAGGSRVVVAEGTVEARAGGQTVRVPAGRACASDPRGRLARPRPASAEELAWAEALAPRRRLLFEATFDDRKLRGFVGALSEAEAAAPGDLCLRLQPLAGNRFWGQWAHAPQGRLPSLRAAPGVALQFSLWTERPAEVLLQARNETQGKDFKRSFAHPGGFWKTFTVALMDLSTYYDPGKHPVREGDLFTDLEVYACEPGDAQVVLLDDVRVYRKLYR